MSFVEWATLAALLVTGALGLILGVNKLVGKGAGQERAFAALLYLSGGMVALAVAILWLASRSI